MKSRLLQVMSVILMASLVFGQSSGGLRPSFEVASIKIHVDRGPGPGIGGIQNIPGSPRIDMMAVTFKMLFAYAYGLRDFQIIGGPDWINSDRYDIQAKAEDGSIPPPTGSRDLNVPNPMALRVQSMLEDRFQLKMHRETRTLPIYELTLARGGSKLQLSPDQSPPEPRAQERGSLFIQRTPAGWILQGTAVRLSSLISVLSDQIAKPIVDKSDFKPGLYDVNLRWAPNRPAVGGAQADGPRNREPVLDDPEELPIFTAIQEQLGLQLVSSKGPVQVFMIDSVQRPSEN